MEGTLDDEVRSDALDTRELAYLSHESMASDRRKSTNGNGHAVTFLEETKIVENSLLSR